MEETANKHSKTEGGEGMGQGDREKRLIEIIHKLRGTEAVELLYEIARCLLGEKEG